MQEGDPAANQNLIKHTSHYLPEFSKGMLFPIKFKILGLQKLRVKAAIQGSIQSSQYQSANTDEHNEALLNYLLNYNHPMRNFHWEFNELKLGVFLQYTKLQLAG